jgi:hypothetical protein
LASSGPTKVMGLAMGIWLRLIELLAESRERH